MKSLNWSKTHLLKQAMYYCHLYFQRYRWAGSWHFFWAFFWQWKRHYYEWIDEFMAGDYRPEPMRGYTHHGRCEPFWTLKDQLFQRLLFQIIKPTIKHVVSRACRHCQGPSAIGQVIKDVHSALHRLKCRYVIRIDIRSYYASIDHGVLMQQIKTSFADKRVIDYFDRIITTVIDRGGVLETPTRGIPRRSVLSAWFAALYLKPLDDLFADRQDLFYVRYNDDIVILCQSKSQFVKAKRRVKSILHDLKLSLARNKSRLGLAGDGFHFLGCQFTLTQAALSTEKQSIKKEGVDVSLHPRSCHRARLKIRQMQEGHGTPWEVQCYFNRWANFWKRVLAGIGESFKGCESLTVM